jgi:hypothetical protein
MENERMNSVARNLNTAQLSFNKTLCGLRYDPMYRVGEEKKTTGVLSLLWETLKLVRRGHVARQTDLKYPQIGSHWKDRHGHIVEVTDTDSNLQTVHYQRIGYDWRCRTPIFLFSKKYRKVEG